MRCPEEWEGRVEEEEEEGVTMKPYLWERTTTVVLVSPLKVQVQMEMVRRRSSAISLLYVQCCDGCCTQREQGLPHGMGPLSSCMIW